MQGIQRQKSVNCDSLGGPSCLGAKPSYLMFSATKIHCLNQTLLAGWLEPCVSTGMSLALQALEITVLVFQRLPFQMASGFS